ncbi:hypothetical protein BDW71DRAFT_172074 [Aspergillus fruticulosus]
MRTSARPDLECNNKHKKVNTNTDKKEQTDEGQVPDRRGCIKQKSQVKHKHRHDDPHKRCISRIVSQIRRK